MMDAIFGNPKVERGTRMNMNNRIILTMGLSVSILILSACGQETEKAKGDPIWKEQTEMIDKAKAIEKTVQDRVKQQLNQADEQSQ